MRWRPRLWCSVALLLPLAAAAQRAPCSAPEHRQFDFWIGHWDVFMPDGKKAGENRIEAIEGGCALLEQWTGARGPTGKSLNIYDGERKRWHQTWVDSSGGLLLLDGAFSNGRMVLSSGGSPTQRITWTPQGDGSVRQLWQSSEDGGKTWRTAFDGRYVKRK
jgi:hypothetical protein